MSTHVRYIPKYSHESYNLFLFTVVTCAHPSAVQGGQYYRELNDGSEVAVQNINKFEYKTILRFKCNSGFEISGNYSLFNRTCQEDEHWSGEEPKCIGMQDTADETC